VFHFRNTIFYLTILSFVADLKVDVHRKNSSDSSDEPSVKNDRMVVLNEVSREKPVVGE
jgi:hypothetical protein